MLHVLLNHKSVVLPTMAVMLTSTHLWAQVVLQRWRLADRIIYQRDIAARALFARLLQKAGVTLSNEIYTEDEGMTFTRTESSPRCASPGHCQLAVPLNHIFVGDAGCSVSEGDHVVKVLTAPVAVAMERGGVLIENFFPVYVSLFRFGGDETLLVDMWNVLVCTLTCKLEDILKDDMHLVKRGGQGDLALGWERLHAMATVLSKKYNVFTRFQGRERLQLQRIHEAAPSVYHLQNLSIVKFPATGMGGALLVADFPEHLLSRVAKVAQSRKGLWSSLKLAWGVVSDSCSITKIVVAFGGMIALRLSQNALWEMTKAFCVTGSGSSLRDVQEQLLDSISMLEVNEARGDAGLSSALQDNVLHVLVDTAASVMRSFAKGISFMTVQFSMDIVMSFVETYFMGHLMTGIESTIIMNLAVQNLQRLQNNRMKSAALECQQNISTFFATVMDKFSGQVLRFFQAKRVSAFPVYFLLCALVWKSETFLYTLNNYARFIGEYYQTFFCADRPPVPTNFFIDDHLTVRIDSLTSNCLVDDAGLVNNQHRDRVLKFAGVNRQLLRAAMNDVPSVKAAEWLNCDEAIGQSSHAVEELLILNKLVERTVEFPEKYVRLPLFGLSVFIAASCSNRSAANRDTDDCYVLQQLADTTEWPLLSTSIEGLKYLALSYRSSPTASPFVIGAQRRGEVTLRLLLTEMSALSSRKSTSHDCPLSGNPTHIAQLSSLLPDVDSSLLSKTNLMHALRLGGRELDVVKACALSEAYSPTAFAHGKHNFMNLLHTTVYRQFAELLGSIPRAAALWYYGNDQISSQRQIDSFEIDARQLVQHFLPSHLTMLSFRHNRGAQEEFDVMQQSSQRQSDESDIGRYASSFGVIANLRALRSECIDKDYSLCTSSFATTVLAVPRDGLSLAPAPLDDSRFHIEFKDVTVSFGAKKVLQGVSFTVERGQFVGIVGVSGVGKTTLLNLLLRMIPPSSGEILLNGRPIDSYPVRMLRRRIAYVCQDFANNGFDPRETVEDNLALGDLSWLDMKEAMKEALQRADCSDFLKKKPLKLKTLANAKLFSGGEAQRLVIARAMMRNPLHTGLLVMDEATSALDGVTEKRIINAVREAQGQQRVTCVAVAHRLATLAQADRIVVLDQGRVVEQGSWRTLASDKGSLFFKMLSAQTVRGESVDDHDEPRGFSKEGAAAADSQHVERFVEDIFRTAMRNNWNPDEVLAVVKELANHQQHPSIAPHIVKNASAVLAALSAASQDS